VTFGALCSWLVDQMRRTPSARAPQQHGGQMTIPTAYRTAVRTTAVVGLTAGLLIVGAASAQAADTPLPPTDGLIGNVGAIVQGQLSNIGDLLANPGRLLGIA
jgi:hypothetical protein